jgi:hypothetical protein
MHKRTITTEYFPDSKKIKVLFLAITLLTCTQTNVNFEIESEAVNDFGVFHQ